MLTPEITQNAASFEDFLTAVEPKLKRLLAVYRIPSEDAEDVLQQALLALLYTWERVRDPESWLFGTVKRHCLMYWRTHKRRIYLAVDSTILEWLSEPIARLAGWDWLERLRREGAEAVRAAMLAEVGTLAKAARPPL